MRNRSFKTYTDYGFGFPVQLKGVQMRKICGNWVPLVDYSRLSEKVLRILCKKKSSLSGLELKFIRTHFEMNYSQFARRFSVTHSAVLKWEAAKNNATGMNWATEKDIRLFVISKLACKSNEFFDLYKTLEETRNDAMEAIEIDARQA